MEAHVLGSAQDGGLPQLLCGCARCLRARGDPARRRTASSVAVVHEGSAWLLDASPDVRHQLAGLPADVPLRAVLLTHAHAGHLTGLVLFGKEGPDAALPVRASPRLAAMLRANEPYKGLLRRMPLREVEPGGSFEEAGLRFTALPIRHREELSDTVAWLVEGRRRLLYLPDTDAFDALALAALARLGPGDVALVDGTFFAAGEVPGRDMALIPHPFVERSLEDLEPVRDRGVRVVFTHLNHTNPLCDPDSAERTRVEAAGYVVAEDGMRFPSM